MLVFKKETVCTYYIVDINILFMQMKVILYMINIKISSVSELNNTVLGGRKLLSVVVQLCHNDCEGSQVLYCHSKAQLTKHQEH